jgi:hypothetical protein
MFKLGDRVSRQIDIGQPPRRYGTIVKVYKCKQGIGFTPHNIYDIKWDNIGEVGIGYLEVSLQKE